MSDEKRTTAMKLASLGSELAVWAILLGPLTGIPGAILGIIALAKLTPEEKAGGMNDNGKVKNKAWTAIVAGIIFGMSGGFLLPLIYFCMVVMMG